jgi:hypothetical protein
MSQKCQQAPHAPRQRASLFNRLISAGEQRGWHIETERFGRFQIDHQFELDRLLYRKLFRFGPFQNPINADSRIGGNVPTMSLGAAAKSIAMLSSRGRGQEAMERQ